MDILIVGGGLQALSFAHSIYHRHKVYVIGRSVQITHSRFFCQRFDSSYLNKDRLFELLEKKHFDVIVPVSDITVPLISQNKLEIEERFGSKCAVPSYEKVSQVADKSRFMTFCDEHEIPHPKTRPLTPDSLTESAKVVGFPALIKPDYSVGARGILRVNDLKELQKGFQGISNVYGSCTLQELIENKEYYYNVMLYRSANGRILAHAIEKIVRMYPVNAGSSSCSISVENYDLLEICKDCLNKLNWVGMADFDVLQRLDNGEYKIIEINPRVPASLKSASASGINFPDIIISDVLGEEPQRRHYSPGKILRYLGLDILWFVKSYSRFRSNPSWFQFFGGKVYYMDIFMDDPSTWWSWLVEGLKKIGNRNKRIR